MKTYKIGLLGFGAMGKVHAFSIQNLNYFYTPPTVRAKIAGVCTTSMEKSEAVAKEYGMDIATDCEDVLINDPTIDIIDVCTPNLYHYETLQKAIRAGKHIYCEKPLCVTYAQAKEIATLAESAGVIGNVVFNNRHLAPIQRAIQLVEEGRIGRVLSFSADYLHNSCIDPDRKAGWKQNRDICGGGVLFDLGSHAIDLVYALCGEVESVCGMAQIAYPTRLGADGNPWETNADEAFYMTARLRSGAVGTVTVSKLVNGANDDLSISVYGEKGSLKFSLMQPNFLYFYDATTQPTTLGGNNGYCAIECVGRYPAPGGSFPAPKAPSGWLRGHIEGIHRFLCSVDSGISSAPTFRDAAHVQAVMEAAYRSANTHREEQVLP
ncbi:MAG: Gfo/Idh/MocA family oxidoreductase [Clostridia bacterium]|nr:Gfo/Idh/MocA family oxidoreductase [Clostridia bacterium]